MCMLHWRHPLALSNQSTATKSPKEICSHCWLLGLNNQKKNRRPSANGLRPRKKRLYILSVNLLQESILPADGGYQKRINFHSSSSLLQSIWEWHQHLPHLSDHFQVQGWHAVSIVHE